MDLCAIGDCGPYSNQGDVGTVGSNATALYNPESMRFRGVAVLTNTPPRVSQRAPGGEQAAAMLEPMISKAARHLGVDQVEIRKINAPVTGSEFGPPPPPAAAGAAAAAAAATGARAGAPGGPPAVAQPQAIEQGRATGAGQQAAGQVPGQQPVAAAAPPAAPRRSFFTSCYLREALDLGAQLFKWDERKARNGQRIGTKVTGVGVGIGTYTAGSIAMDGLLLVRNDGKVYVHSGIGNLGTGSVMDCSQNRRRRARHAVGADRNGLGQHEQASRVELAAGGQPDDSRAHARESCGGAGPEEEAAGDRGARAGRPSRELHGGQRPRRAGSRSRRRPKRRSSMAASSPATRCLRTSTT